jgi:hypothetical protein
MTLETPQTEGSGEEAELKRQFYPLDHEKYQGIAAAKGYDQSEQRLQRTHYSHEAMIDVLIAEPTITQGELAIKFNRTQGWISRIIGSDSFQGALAKRREEITDPFLVATIEERMKCLATQSLDVLARKLDLADNADIALKTLDITTKALGFGARHQGGNTVNNFVVQMPDKAPSIEDWASKNGGGQGAIIEHKNFSTTVDRDPLTQPKSLTLARE